MEEAETDAPADQGAPKAQAKAAKSAANEEDS